MLKRILLFVLLLPLACSPGKEHPMPAEPPSPVIMAYFMPGRNYAPEEVPVEKLTHIIYSFAKVVDGELKFQDEEVDKPRLEALVRQRARNPALKVMIACGGWGADGFSDMARTREGSQRFIRSAHDFISKYNLDGIDIDWEYPGISGAGTMARPEDRDNFTVLLKGLREMLNTFDEPKILTFASAGWKVYYDHIDTEVVMKYVDYMNVMTYDQVSGVSIFTGHHTPLGDVKSNEIRNTPFGIHLDSLYQAGASPDPHPRSVEKIVDFLLRRGVNPRQIVIGAAFYGRAWKGVPPDNHGLYQKSNGIHIGWSAYHQIRETFETDTAYHRYWDSQARAPFLYNPTDSIFISYDDTVSVALKTSYAREQKLGGIMFWELGNDTKEKGSLLDAIHAAAMDEKL